MAGHFVTVTSIATVFQQFADNILGKPLMPGYPFAPSAETKAALSAKKWGACSITTHRKGREAGPRLLA